MDLYLGGLKSGINFALETKWTYIRVKLYLDGLLFEILRYQVTIEHQIRKSGKWRSSIYLCSESLGYKLRKDLSIIVMQ